MVGGARAPPTTSHGTDRERGTPGVTAVAEQRVPEASRVNLCSRTAVNSALASGSPLVTTLVRENSRGQTWIHLYL